MNTNDVIRLPDGTTLYKKTRKPYNGYNKRILQSYILTTARYDFNIYEKRILYKIVEIAQSEVLGLKFPKDCKKIQHDLFGNVDITLPIASILANEEDRNHSKVKKSLLALSQKFIIYEDKNIWEKINLVVFPKIRKFETSIEFTIHPQIWDCILDFSKGFRALELKTTMNFESVYTMRFYELLSGQEKPLTFLIDELKHMFQVQEKYRSVNMFIKKVIAPAKKELDKKSPYSFEFKINKQGKKFHSITFYPVKIQENQDLDLEKQKVLKEVSLHWSLDRGAINYLKEVFFFDTKELKQHQELLENAYKMMDLIGFLAEKKRYILEAKNPKGYLISCLKKEVEKLSNAFFDTDFNPPENASEESKKLFKEVSKLKNKLTQK